MGSIEMKILIKGAETWQQESHPDYMAQGIRS